MRRHTYSAAAIALVLLLAAQCLPGLSQGVTFTRPLTFDDYWAQMADMVPDLCGVYLDPYGQVQVLLLESEPARAPQLVQALGRVFGVEVLTDITGTSRALRDPGALAVQPGAYSVRALLDMKQRLLHLLEVKGVLYIDVDEMRNRILVAVADDFAAQLVPLHVRHQGIPDGAIVVEVMAEHSPIAEEEDLLALMLEEWHKVLRSERFGALPGLVQVTYIRNDRLTPFRIEITSPSAVLLLARELRATGVPLCLVLTYQRE